MSEFDSRAKDWDKDKMHMERSAAIAERLRKMIPLSSAMKALEMGAGTGILSFMLREELAAITLVDNSSGMIEVCEQKIEYLQTKHIKALCMDLEQTDPGEKYDLIYSQMVLHHVTDVEAIFQKFYALLNPGGYLAIADLYTEDGSFHGPEVKVHLGFDPETLANQLEANGFNQLKFETCYEIKRESGKTYPVFLLVGQK
jgi:2-polyprenyl-3-methyl-5-hydroxy-6-metoxy-1,4-benzoquinol methylase